MQMGWVRLDGITKGVKAAKVDNALLLYNEGLEDFFIELLFA